MSTEAPVCVIVVNYNGGSLLRRCIETLSGQTLLPQEIIIVDNGSADGSTASLNDLPVMKTGRVKIITPAPIWVSPPLTTWAYLRPERRGSPR